MRTKLWTKSRSDEMIKLFKMIMLSLFSAFCSFACVSDKAIAEVNGEPVYLNPSKEFDLKSEQFKISPERAQKIALEYRRSQQPNIRMHVLGPLVAIVGDFYVFAIPEKDGLSLSGVYVHGNKGKVEERIVDKQKYTK